jgi:hypothetical protein
MKAQLEILKTYSIGTIFLENKKKIILDGLSKLKLNFDPSKIRLTTISSRF